MPLRWPPFALAAAIVALDQLTKAWVVAEVPLGARVASWAGLVHLTHTRNAGAAFGLLGGFSLDLGAVTIDGVQLLGLVSLLVAVALAVWLARARELGWGTRLALGAVMGGAIGNGIDRWRLHYVVDFVHLQAGWFDFPVFNVADMGISIGAGLLLLATLLTPARGHHRDDASPGSEGPPAAEDSPGSEGSPVSGASPGGDALSDAPSRTDDDR
jgi:signal peptidase II